MDKELIHSGQYVVAPNDEITPERQLIIRMTKQIHNTITILRLADIVVEESGDYDLQYSIRQELKKLQNMKDEVHSTEWSNMWDR